MRLNTYQPNCNWARADQIAKERREAQAMKLLTDVYSTFEGLVHIGNMGVLPPSPKVVYLKARQLGILTDSESTTLFWQYC